MRIAVDAMGGDHAPEAPVRATVSAASAAGGRDIRLLLVGPADRVMPLLGKDGEDAIGRGHIELVPASQVIGPEDHPVAALREKKDSSIVVGLRLVKEKKADAFVSAGSTGAVMAGAFREFGRIRGVPRPALGTVFPSLAPGSREFLLLDLGANADARPEHLRAYAVMGSVYAQKVMGRPSPKVGLLNIGVEPTKGNELAKAAHQLMTRTPGLNFVGNIEGRDILAGPVDVLITDGFTGNIMMKVVEGFAESLFALMKEEFTRNLRGKLGALLLVPSFRSIKRRLDYAEVGGAPFLGVNGPCVKCHGSSNAKAIANGIAVAERFAGGRVIEVISEQLKAIGDSPPDAGGEGEE